MENEYYLVIENIFNKKFRITDKKEDFENEYYDVYIKFILIEDDKVKITENITQNPNVSFYMKFTIGTIINMLNYILQINQIFKLKRKIDKTGNVIYQLRHNRLLEYEYKDKWYDLPTIEDFMKKFNYGKNY